MKSNNFLVKSLIFIIVQIFCSKVFCRGGIINSYLYIYFILFNLNLNFIKNILLVFLLGVIWDLFQSDLCNHSFAAINTLAFAYATFLKRKSKDLNEDFIEQYEIMKSNLFERLAYIFKASMVYQFSLVLIKVIDCGVSFISFKSELLMLLVNIAMLSVCCLIDYAFFKKNSYKYR